MRAWIRLLLIVFAMVAAVGCIFGGGGRPRTGTNIGTGSDSGGPWSKGDQTPAHTGAP